MCAAGTARLGNGAGNYRWMRGIRTRIPGKEFYEEERNEVQICPTADARRVLCLSGTLNRAIAQVDSGRIIGLVLDAKNASIAGATITVVDERTSEERTAKSNTDGAYEIVALKPSFYTIKVSADQFAPANRQDFN